MGEEKKLVCPSSNPYFDNAKIIGVVEDKGEGSRVTFLPIPVNVTKDLLGHQNAARFGEVLRVAAKCVEAACAHFREQNCILAKKIVVTIDAEIDQIPICSIRSHCVWWNQEGRQACMRCPQIVTRPTKEATEVRGMPLNKLMMAISNETKL